MRPIITDAAWSIGVSVCLLVTTVSCAKADKPIEMPLGTRTRVGTRNDVLGGGIGSLLREMLFGVGHL